jgi:uncharacterized protein YhhL (DUF1145 family)
VVSRRLFAPLVVAITVGGLVVPATVAPGSGLAWLLFVGSSVHVAATAALFSFADVRRHAYANPRRYLAAPLALVAIAAATAALLPERQLSLLILGFLGWQLWHYQQQNLGLAALAARATGQPALTTTERRCIRTSAAVGILALIANPQVTQLLDIRPPANLTVTALAAAWLLITAALITVAAHRRRPSTTHLAVAFPLPLLLTTSPYAALGGMTLAHGLQYLLLVGLVVAGPANKRPSATKATLLLTGVLAVAALLATAAHLHHGPAPTRAIFGAYLGIVMTHFVLDAGLWRLRDPFPRQWLGVRLPTLLADTSASGIASRPWPRPRPPTASVTSGSTPARPRSSSPAWPKDPSTATR